MHEVDEPFITRDDGAEFVISTLGVPMRQHTLRGLWQRGLGPKYVVINGRQLTKRSWLREWVAEQANRPPPRRGGDRAPASAS